MHQIARTTVLTRYPGAHPGSISAWMPQAAIRAQQTIGWSITSAKTPAADSDWGSPLLSRRSAEVSAGASSSAATLSVCDRLLRLQEELLLPLNAGQVLTRAVHGCLLLSWAEVLAASGRQVQAGSVGDLSSCAPAMMPVCTRVWSGIRRPRRKRTTRRQCGT